MYECHKLNKYNNTNGNKTGCGYICANYWTKTFLLSSGINVASSKIYHYKWHGWIIENSWMLCLGDNLDKYEILDWCPLSAILIIGLL